MKTPLDSKRLKEFLTLAGDQLSGDWILLGGTLLPAVGLNVRTTVDIDFVSLGKTDNSQTLALMTIADSLGLPVETINSAASFFLEKLSYSKEDLLVLHKGRTAKIFRPSVSLYWRLKLARLSDSDLVDCQHYYNFCMSQKDPINIKELEQSLTVALKNNPTKEKKDKLSKLQKLLASSLKLSRR